MELTDKDVDDTPAQTTLSLEAAMKVVARVEVALAERGFKCHSGSALGSLFAMVRRLVSASKPLNDQRRRVTFLRANEAVRIARAIEIALDEAGAKEAIHRITISDMNLATRQHSMGKDALWELDLYRRLKLGGLPVRFDEPDLVLSMGDGLGDYAIACKKTYSEKNVADVFKLGCAQIIRGGRPGVVAFNLDDLIPESEVWTAPTAHALKERLDKVNCEFIRRNEAHFRDALQRGDCDGILVSTSVISCVPDMRPPISLTRSTAVSCCGVGLEAKMRVDAFRECLDRTTAWAASFEMSQV